MTTKPPPVPPANRSDKGPGEGSEARAAEIAKGAKVSETPEKQGRTGDAKSNAAPQNLQQDR